MLILIDLDTPLKFEESEFVARKGAAETSAPGTATRRAQMSLLWQASHTF